MIPLIIISIIESIVVAVLWSIIVELRRTIRQDNKDFEIIKTALSDEGKKTDALKKENRALRLAIKPIKEALAEATNDRNLLATTLRNIKLNLDKSKRKNIWYIKASLDAIEVYEKAKENPKDEHKGMDI